MRTSPNAGAVRVIRSLTALCVLFVANPFGSSLCGQALPTPRGEQSPKLQVAVTGIALRSLSSVTGEGFGQGGGTASAAYRVWGGFSVVADLMGTHTSSAGTTGSPLSLITTTFGPRYQQKLSDRVSVYGQGLVGVANGFGGSFPSGNSVRSSANSLALQAGVGLDVNIDRRFSIRALDADYVRTQLPNSADNIQNNFRIGAGLVLRFH